MVPNLPNPYGPNPLRGGREVLLPWGRRQFVPSGWGRQGRPPGSVSVRTGRGKRAGAAFFRRTQRGGDTQAQAFPQPGSGGRRAGCADGGVILFGPRLKEHALAMPVVFTVPRALVAEAVDRADFQVCGYPLPRQGAGYVGHVLPRQGQPAGERFLFGGAHIVQNDLQPLIRQAAGTDDHALHGDGPPRGQAFFQPCRILLGDAGSGLSTDPPARDDARSRQQAAKGAARPAVRPYEQGAGRQSRNRETCRDDSRGEQQDAGFPEQERLKRRDGRHRLFCRHGASCFGKEKEDGKGEARFWGKGPLRFSSRSQVCRCGAFSGCAYRIFLKGPVRLCRQLCIIY